MLTDDEIAEVYRTAKSFAIVGASREPGRDSGTAVAYLHGEGYEVYPVNPTETEVAGLRAFASIGDLPATPDVVVVFRKPGVAGPVAREAIEAGARVVWLPVGVTSDEAREIAGGAGRGYVEDRCVYTTHKLMKRAGMIG